MRRPLAGTPHCSLNLPCATAFCCIILQYLKPLGYSSVGLGKSIQCLATILGLLRSGVMQRLPNGHGPRRASAQLGKGESIRYVCSPGLTLRCHMGERMRSSYYLIAPTP